METEIQNSELAGRKARKEDERARPEGGAVSNLKWTCNRCRMGFRVESPFREETEWHTCPEKGCGRRFWSVSANRHAGENAKVGIWPMPEWPVVTGSNIIKAAINLERVWNASKSGDVHASKLMEAVTGVCRAVQAIKGKS